SRGAIISSDLVQAARRRRIAPRAPTPTIISQPAAGSGMTAADDAGGDGFDNIIRRGAAGECRAAERKDTLGQTTFARFTAGALVSELEADDRGAREVQLPLQAAAAGTSS